MLAITNATRHAADATILADPEGRDLVVAVAKATFAIVNGRRAEPVDEPAPLCRADEYRDEPATSSLSAAADFAPGKPRADVVVLGHARARGGRAVTEMTLAVRVGPVSAKLDVVGDRVWKKGLLGVSAGKPERFTAIPLVWERAYGGSCPAKEGDGLVSYRPNPVGRGFWLTDGDAADQPLPNFEWPDDPLKKLVSRPAPAGLGFVSPDWESRAALAGTYDARWEKSRMPLLPEDFDPGYFNVAPAALQSPRFFEGGEPVRLSGLHEEGEFAFELPRDRIEVDLLTPGDRVETRPAVLDTVVIDADAGRVMLTWRACVRAPEPLTRLQHVRIRSERFPAPGETAGAAGGAGGARG